MQWQTRQNPGRGAGKSGLKCSPQEDDEWYEVLNGNRDRHGAVFSGYGCSNCSLGFRAGREGCRDTEGPKSRSPGRDMSRPYMADGVMRGKIRWFHDSLSERYWGPRFSEGVQDAE